MPAMMPLKHRAANMPPHPGPERMSAQFALQSSRLSLASSLLLAPTNRMQKRSATGGTGAGGLAFLQAVLLLWPGVTRE